MNPLKRTTARSLPSKVLPTNPAPRSLVGGSLINNPAKAPGTKIGMNQLGDRTKASAPVPSLNAGEGQNRTTIYTYFTKPGPTEILYPGDRLWARVKLELETAGPVVVGSAESLLPITSGKGQRLTTGDEIEFVISKGSRIYIAATGVNRVKVTIEPIPWLEQMTALLGVAAIKQ